MLGFCLLLTGCSAEDLEGYLEEFQTEDSSDSVIRSDFTEEGDALCTVYFLDVGQGDSELIVTQDAAVLIDGGEMGAGEEILADLQEYGVSELDWIIVSHPHADHIGGLPYILEYAAENSDLSVENIMMPVLPNDMIPTSATYERLLDGIEENNLSITDAEEMDLDLGSAALEIYPSPGEYSDLNNYSIVCMLDCAGNTILFTGDCSEQEEEDLLQEGVLQDVDVLKVGHHGSRESSSEEFLEEVSPEAAVISCGADNSYGHPHEEAVERLSAYVGENLFRTDENGTVTAELFQDYISFDTEQ